MSDTYVCGCGKEARYSHFDEDRNEVGSCNKYRRCLTRHELEEALISANTQLIQYQTAVGKVVDYFGQLSIPKKYRDKVIQIIENLKDALE